MICSQERFMCLNILLRDHASKIVRNGESWHVNAGVVRRLLEDREALATALLMLTDVSDHRMSALTHAQLVNLVRDIRSESRAALAKAAV